MSTPEVILLFLLLLAIGAWLLTQKRGADLESRIRYFTAQSQSRQVLEARLTELEARQKALEALSEVAYEDLLLIDQDHQVQYMNAAARSLFAPPGGSNPYGESIIALTRQHELDDLVAATLENDEDRIDGQVTIEWRPYRVRTMRAETAEGPYVVAAMEDVGELQRLGRARRDMVANISHELRTPITSIRLLVDTLLRGMINDPQRSQPLLEKIATETSTLQQMAQELLDLAMIESGRAEIKLIPNDLRAIADEAVARLEELATRKQLEICDDIPASLMVLADPEYITRVLTNLLHNAIKFTPSGGQITLSAERGPETVTVSVTDTGSGIPVIERERIFERFYRSDRARGGSGTGLGLAIAKHIIEAHGGRIWATDPPRAESGRAFDAAHPGAHLCFTLPAAEN